MILEQRVPVIGESINEVTLSQWLVEEGDYVEMDQSLCEFESDKATLEFPAEKAGIIKFVAEEGADLAIGDLICTIDTDAVAPKKEKPAAASKPKEVVQQTVEVAPAIKTTVVEPAKTSHAEGHASPAAAKLMAENGVQPENLQGSGKAGRITKADVLKLLAAGVSTSEILKSGKKFSRGQERKKMSRLRQTIARRLVGVKNETAMLTTFNEVDLGAIMAIRKKYKEPFKTKHGVNLGFMGFFTKACSNALLEYPAVNAQIDGKELIFNDFCDVSIAVSTPRGLVVPIIRNAESLHIWEIESTIKDLAIRARNGKLSLEEMEGGTFSITNGGVFGSLMSTPIINAPQSAILGMHNILERPMAVNGKVEIRPMMYLALSYDHRVVDGKQSVSFLVRVKEQLENPQQLLFGADPVELLLEL